MRDNLAAYNAAGASSVFLSGNTCWFQVRFDYSANQMVCYKVAEFDPYFSTSSAAYTTTNWHLPPVNRASSTTTGLMWSGHLTADVDATGTGLFEFLIRAGQESNPVLAGLQGLLHGEGGRNFGAYHADPVGFTRSVANGAELDAMVNTCFVGNHPAPADLVPLADVLLPCGDGPPSGVATMCMFEHAFNAATYRWAHGLSTPLPAGNSRWTAMDQITLNVLDQFLGRQNVAAGCAVTASSTHEGDGWSAANLTSGDLAAGWSSDLGAPSRGDHVEWFWVEFPVARTISQVVLYPRRDSPFEGAGFPVSFRIDLWNGTAWVTRVTRTHYPDPGAAPQVFSWGHSDTTSHVRVVATKLQSGSSGYVFQLAELRAY
jgi:hypothetical protein